MTKMDIRVNSMLNVSFRVLIANVALLSALSICSGCSSLRAPAAPTTPFLEHGSELHPWFEHAPWDAVWSSNPGQIMALSDHIRKIYIPEVNTTYLNGTENKSGKWVEAHNVKPEDVKAITDLIHKSFSDAINLHPESNLVLVKSPGPGVLNLQLALVELAPTSVGINSVADVGGLLIPGSKVIEDTASVGVQAAGGAIAAGTIAIEMKLTDSNGNILAEMKDRENDPASVIPNYRDFEEFGWSRYTISEWAKQFIEVFSTAPTDKISSESNLSIAPW
ncbi:MAG: DUF3313 family protein [Deltaproteobacteria bacterium]|nr:DUF3313 family protein [Deltaproteobacteria bacterium]